MAFQFVALVDRVAYECAVTRREILGPSRQAAISDARGIAVYCSRLRWGYGYARLGKLFHRSHATARYLDIKTQGLVEYDERVQRIVNRIMEEETTCEN